MAHEHWFARSPDQPVWRRGIALALVLREPCGTAVVDALSHAIHRADTVEDRAFYQRQRDTFARGRVAPDQSAVAPKRRSREAFLRLVRHAGDPADAQVFASRGDASDGELRRLLAVISAGTVALVLIDTRLNSRRVPAWGGRARRPEPTPNTLFRSSAHPAGASPATLSRSRAAPRASRSASLKLGTLRIGEQLTTGEDLKLSSRLMGLATAIGRGSREMARTGRRSG